MKGLVLAVCLAFALMLLAGCTGNQQGAQKQPMPGSDRDEHGCIGSAGYSWCESLQQCIRPWETNCSNQVLKYNAGPEGQQPVNSSMEGNGSQGLGDDVKVVAVGAIAPFPNNTATIGEICHDEVVEADCRLRNRTAERMYEADGTPTGETQHHETLLNNEDVAANCTVAFEISYIHNPSKYVNYTAVLGPHELSKEFIVSTWTDDDGAWPDARAFGTKVEKVCLPYQGAAGNNSQPTGNNLPNLSIKTETIDKICGDEVVDAWCSATTYVEYQVLAPDGRPTGYYQNVVALYNRENVTANCTVRFVRIPAGGTEQFTNYTAVLGPHETSQNYSITSPNSYAGREEFSGSMVQRVCRPYPGN